MKGRNSAQKKNENMGTDKYMELLWNPGQRHSVRV